MNQINPDATGRPACSDQPVKKQEPLMKTFKHTLVIGLALSSLASAMAQATRPY